MNVSIFYWAVGMTHCSGSEVLAEAAVQFSRTVAKVYSVIVCRAVISARRLTSDATMLDSATLHAPIVKPFTGLQNVLLAHSLGLACVDNVILVLCNCQL